ncbi:MAG TPA: hypothetical protein VNS09_21560 [Solirubrobacter sp.]|nr:hypothetical protein [Solirubrobacter sp.]
MLVLLVPRAALASINYTIEVKAHPSVFKAHTEVDVPVYLVENRAPDVDVSSFAKYPFGLREVYFDIGSVQSRFVSFTPDAAFDGHGKNNPSAEGLEVYKNTIINIGNRSRIYLMIYSTRGAPATVDASGITGRTERVLGTLRIAVGAHADVGNGQKIVLDYTVGDDPSSIDPGFGWWRKVPDSSGNGWATTGGTGITWPRQTRVFWDGTIENEGNAPGDGSAGPNGGADGSGGTGVGGTGTGAGSADGGSDPGAGPQAPGISAVGYSGKLSKAKKKSKQPFTVLTKKPAKGTPAVKVAVTGKTSLRASLAKVGAKNKLTRLKGEKVFEVTSLETYLKLTGSWNNKTLPKGKYRLTLRSPSGVAYPVEFTVK